VIAGHAGHAGISVAADTATRVKGSRPGIAYTWTPAVPEAPRDEAPPDKPRAYRLAQSLAR
jgi:hypothetical protein